MRHRLRTIAATIALGLATTGTIAAEHAPPGRPLYSFGFEDGLEGWTVEDGPRSPDTWTHTDEATRGRGAVALSGYHNNAATTITSPPLSVPDGSVLEFRAMYWLEGCYCDTVGVKVRTVGALDWTNLDTIYGRGRWPVWDYHRYNFPAGGDIEIAFEFISDEGCAGGAVKPSSAELHVNASMCGTGFWFDDVVVAPAAAFDHARPGWGDGPRAHSIVHPAGASAVGDPAGAVEALMAMPPTTLGTWAGRNEFDDQLTNPGFLAALDAGTGAIHMDDWWRDPMADHDAVRTREAWFTNRYRTPVGLRMYAPVEDGPHPLLVFVGALGGAGWTGYDAMIERLVLEGYVVASVVPQGDGHFSSIRSAVLPAPEFCGGLEETAGSWWRQRQEGGLVETQACAGLQGDFTASSAEELGSAYRDAIGAPHVFSMLDAADWLVGDDNPWARLIDNESGIGTFGNSAGAWAAMAVAQLDDRVTASAMLDGYGTLEGLPPTTPTLTFAYDGHDTLRPYLENPLGVAEGLREAGIDAGFVHHLDTGHLDSTWSPLTTGSAIVGAIYVADYTGNVRNSLAKPIHQHYLLAWFDRYLKADASAAERLTLDAFDGSADRTARGQGRWVPGQGNTPYTIEGLSVEATLNDQLTSWMVLDGEETPLN